MKAREPRVRMSVVTVVALTFAIAAAGAHAGESAPRSELRVCADPFNLPMSNKEQEGYENKIAELFGRELGIPVVYEWFPQRIGFIRNTLRNDETEDGSYKCDLVMGVIENFEIAQPTRPYLHSTWAMVYVKGRGLDSIESQDDLATLTDEQKSKLRIGVWDRGPATDLVFHAGLMEYAIPFQSMSGDARENPGKIIERDLVNDRVNLTFVWGPIAGYYAQQITDHEIKVIPLQNRPGLRFDFQISMAVRFGEKAWKEQVDQLIEDNIDEINAILASYNVPMMDLVVREQGDNDDDD